MSTTTLPEGQSTTETTNKDSRTLRAAGRIRRLMAHFIIPQNPESRTDDTITSMDANQANSLGLDGYHEKAQSKQPEQLPDQIQSTPTVEPPKLELVAKPPLPKRPAEPDVNDFSLKTEPKPNLTAAPEADMVATMLSEPLAGPMDAPRHRADVLSDPIDVPADAPTPIGDSALRDVQYVPRHRADVPVDDGPRLPQPPTPAA